MGEGRGDGRGGEIASMTALRDSPLPKLLRGRLGVASGQAEAEAPL